MLLDVSLLGHFASPMATQKHPKSPPPEAFRYEQLNET